MAPLATESYSRKMTGDAADDPIWDAFVDAMLALGATRERGSRYGDKPALVLGAREIAHREGPGLIDLRLTRQGWADVRAVFAGDPLVHRDPGRRDWIELRLRSPDDLAGLWTILARGVAANQPGGMAGHDAALTIGENYRRFARLEAAGRSPAYEQLALAVAADAVIVAFLQGLPPAKRQPNLLFAAARWMLGSPAEIGSLRALVTRRPGELAAVMAARRTQTNEAARCAVLLPALVVLPGPLALIEVGASAGLTLLVDRYSYDYEGHLVTGADPQAPVLRCRPGGPVPLPNGVPEVAWRAGLDLNPLDAADEDDAAWLSCLLWPGETGRAERLAGALATARRSPPALHRGDLLDDLPGLAGQAPPRATLVVYHSAVLAYVDERKRREFAAAVRKLGAVWLSNEAPGVLPDVKIPSGHDGAFVLVRDGTQALARTDPHGTWLTWLP
jgi:hypothetical protein